MKVKAKRTKKKGRDSERENGVSCAPSNLLPILSASPLSIRFLRGGRPTCRCLYRSGERGRVNGHGSEHLVHDGSLNRILVGDAWREPEHELRCVRERRGAEENRRD